MSNIIVNKERHREDKTVWLSEGYLLQRLNGLSEQYLRCKARVMYRNTVKALHQNKDILPDTGKIWRYMRFNGQFYYDYERISDTSPTYYKSTLGAKKDLMKEQPGKHDDLKTVVEDGLNKAIHDGFKEYLHYYIDYEQEQREKLSRACATLEFLKSVVLERGISDRDNKFWIMAAHVLKDGDVGYVPNNYRRLKEKVEKGKDKTIVDLVDLKGLGNKNAMKYDDSTLQSWVYQMRAMPENYTNAFITRRIRKMCLLSGKAMPSDSWFNEIYARQVTKFLTSEGRYGKNGRRAQIYNGYIPIEGAVFAGDVWFVDATRVNMVSYLKKVNINGKDVMREEFMQQICVMDGHSMDILGVHLDTKESAIGYIMAVMMAAKTSGYLPYEIVFDRFPGHNTEEWKLVVARMEHLGVKVTVTHKANGKAKLERLWGTLQTVFMSESKYYYGEGIVSNRQYAHRTADYIYQTKKSAKADGWNFDEAWDEANKIINAYKQTPLSEYSRRYKLVTESPMELHEQSEKPHVVKLSAAELVLVFGQTKEMQIRSGLISTEINSVSYLYEVTDYEVLSNQKMVVLAYDIEDLSVVYLFETTKNVVPKYLGTARQAKAAQIYGPNANFKQLGKSKQRIAEIDTKRKENLKTLQGEVGEEVMLMGVRSDKNAVMQYENGWVNDGAVGVVNKVDESDGSMNLEDFMYGQM